MSKANLGQKWVARGKRQRTNSGKRQRTNSKSERSQHNKLSEAKVQLTSKASPPRRQLSLPAHINGVLHRKLSPESGPPLYFYYPKVRLNYVPDFTHCWEEPGNNPKVVTSHPFLPLPIPDPISIDEIPCFDRKRRRENVQAFL